MSSSGERIGLTNDLGGAATTSDISFCDHVALRIHSPDTINTIVMYFRNTLLTNIVEKSNEFTIDLLNRRLRHLPHLLALRTMGTRYLLYLVRLDGENQCIFVRRHNAPPIMIRTPKECSPDFHDDLFSNGGTLLEGEMVRCLPVEIQGEDGTSLKKHKTWRFVVNDIISRSGVHLSTTNICKRLWILHDIFTSRYKHSSQTLCDIETRRYFRYNDMDTLLSEVSRTDAPYRYSAVVFKPMHLKFAEITLDLAKANMLMMGEELLCKGSSSAGQQVANNFHPFPRCQMAGHDNNGATNVGQACFFAMRSPRPDTYILYDHDRGTSGEDRVAAVNSMEVSRFMRALFADAPLNERRRVLCEYSERFSRWVPQGGVPPP